MALCRVCVFLVIYHAMNSAYSQEDVVFNALKDDRLFDEITEEDVALLRDKITMTQSDEKVEIKCYYETLCPDCRNLFTSQQFKDVLLKLTKYIRLLTYPYGNAETSENNGTIEFRCQHGPQECYGNKLDACSLDTLIGTEAVLYNVCMMEYSQSGKGSDDEAADKCGKSMSVNAEPIKECAKGDKGVRLLKYYGEESKKVGYRYVPYILIDGNVNDGNNFFRDVCASISHPPDACNEI